MTTKITRVLSFAEYRKMQDDALAQGFYRNDRRVFVPGLAWYQPFYFDPLGELAALPADDHYRREAMIKQRPADPNARGFLSPHYWRDWADQRPPICVVCPNGEQWEIDRWSSSGDGWTVRGALPEISVTPSIVVEGYHGYLGSNGAPPGTFTADLDGRGPCGIARPIS